jgi:hypothetical protein
VYRRLGSPVSLATGGSTSTVVDTQLAVALGEGNEDDIYNGGSVIIIKDSAGAAAAPEGEFSRITDYVATTTTITVSPLVSTAVAAGDTYLVAAPDYPLYDMIELMNDALDALGDILVEDTSLSTSATATEYTLPLAVRQDQLIDVSYQGVTGVTGDNEWIGVAEPISIRPAAPGVAGTLVLPELASGRTLRITYLGKHPRVSAYADYISQSIRPELMHALAFAHAIQWRNDQDGAIGAQNKARLELEEKAWSQVDRAFEMYPINRKPRRVPGFVHYTSGGFIGNYDRDALPRGFPYR